MASEKFPPLDQDERTQVALGALPDHRLPGHVLLLGPQDQRSQEPGRSGPGNSQDLREARRALARTGNAGRGGRGRGVRQRLGGNDLQEEARRDGGHLLLLLRGGSGAPGPDREIPGHGGALQRQLLRGLE